MQDGKKKETVVEREDNKIFALFEKYWSLILGYVPLGETELKIIEAPDSSALAVYENFGISFTGNVWVN